MADHTSQTHDMHLHVHLPISYTQEFPHAAREA